MVIGPYAVSSHMPEGGRCHESSGDTDRLRIRGPWEALDTTRTGNAGDNTGALVSLTSAVGDRHGEEGVGEGLRIEGYRARHRPERTYVRRLGLAAHALRG
jgi:hypothetical protein